MINSPASLLPEMRNKGLGGADRSHHIRIDHAHDLVVRKTFERTRQAIAGVVENDVAPPLAMTVLATLSICGGSVISSAINVTPESC